MNTLKKIADPNLLTSSSSITAKSLTHFPELFSLVKKQFESVLTDLYGSQDKSLEKIKKGDDRRTLIFFNQETPVGILVHKRDPSQEYASYKIKNSLEIKTLFVIDAKNNSNKGYASEILNKVVEYAKKYSFSSIHVTVSEMKPESKAFFEKKGFTLIHSFKDLYQKGVIENLYSLNLQKKEEKISLKRKYEEDPYESNFTNISQKKICISRAPKIQRVTLFDRYINQIINGTKTVEGRINDGMFSAKNFSSGDILEFYSKKNSVRCYIEDVIVYKNFQDMLQNEGYQKCVSEALCLEDAIDIYNSIPSYKERSQRHGVVAFRIKKLYE